MILRSKTSRQEGQKHKEQRVAILIDVQNMYHSAKNLYGRKVNFKEVLKIALAGRKLIRAIAYGIKTEAEEEKGFFEALRHMGIEVKMKNLQVFAGGFKKGDWDVGITVDAIKFAEGLDVIILVTGDGDFIPLIEYLKSAKAARAEIVAFGNSCSGRLKQVSDDFVDLEENPQKFLLK